MAQLSEIIRNKREGNGSIDFEKPEAIDADVFFQIEINVKDKNVMIGDKNLTVDGKAITTELTVNGGVN